jgi:hypothetical protein
VGNLLMRHIESHEIEAPDPHLQGLRMAGKEGIGKLIKACVAVATLVALTGGFRVSSQPRLLTCVDSHEEHAMPSGQRSSRTV